MALCCTLADNAWSIVATLLCVLVTSRLFLRPSARRRPSLPPRSSARTLPRGTGDVMQCVSPANGEVIGNVRAYTPADVVACVKSARVAQRGESGSGGRVSNGKSQKAAAAAVWGASSFAERRALLQDIIDWIVANQEEIIALSMRDSGKTVTEATMGEVLITCEKLRWLIKHGERCLAREYRPVATLLAFTKRAYVDYKPLGVIGVIVPWNYPFHNVLSAAAAALMAGNGVVIKVSEYASYGAERIETVLREIIAKRGYDPNLIHVITGMGETGSALVTSGVDKVLFIGSPAVGKLVMRAASANLTPVILELGGKDPFIVFDDVDLEHCLDIAIRGAFINCGQNCISAERIYVQSGVHDRFVEEIVKRVRTLSMGASSCKPDGRRCDFGAITMPAQVKNYESLIDDAVQKGAKLLHGGVTYTDGDATGKGVYFKPTILSDVTHKMRIANEEAFGPIMSIFKFDSEEEVIEQANCTNFGLGSCVFTRSLARAERVTSQLETGMTSINDFGMVPMVQSLPFGGVKHSGFGAFNGREGLIGFSRTHAVVTDRFPGMRTQTPKFLQYPVSKYAATIAQAAVKMIYGPSWMASAQALATMMKNIMKA